MQDKRDDGSSPEPAQTPTTPMQAQQKRHTDNRDALHALAKDAQNVAAHSLILQERSRRTLDAARAIHARSRDLECPQDPRMTVPEACHLVGICERTLRLTLREPALAARVQQGTRKAGTFYKAIQLLPPDLVEELQLRFAPKKKAAHYAQ